MTITIIGSGAMGSLFGGRLSLAGEEVVLYDTNREHLEKVRGDGLAIEDAAGGPAAVARPKVATEPEDAARSEALIVFVKSTATEAVASLFGGLARSDAVVLTLQNGLGNEEIIRRHFGASRTAAGVTSQGATFLGPGRIRHAGRGPTHLGMSDGRNERLSGLAEALDRAGFETHLEKDVAALVWGKLIVNVGINALTALIGQTNGRLLEFEETKAVMADLVAEAVSVARALGIPIAYDDPFATVCEVARRTGANRSSMLQDFDRGRETEIGVMNGAIVREAERLGMPAPVNATIARLIKALDRMRAAKGQGG